MPSPQTVVRGNNASTAAYVLAPGVFQYIESVHVEVDTSGSGEVAPTLEVQTQDGVVMAAKQQGRAIDGGTTGRATWSLRDADENDDASAQLGAARAHFTGPEIEAGAVKTLLGARANTIAIPLDFLLVPSADFQWVETFPGSSSIELDAGGALVWYFFSLAGFGVTQWVSLSQMIGDPSTDGIPRAAMGEPLTVKSAPGAGLNVTAGSLEVFVRWYRVTVTN